MDGRAGMDGVDVHRLLDQELVYGPIDLPPATVEDLTDVCLANFHAGHFTQAQIGRGATKTQLIGVRGDCLCWIDDWLKHPALLDYANFLERLRSQLREVLHLPLRRFEGHFSVYEPGSFYQRHWDQHSGNPHRQVTCILYLSDSDPDDGGTLRAWNSQGQEFVIQPQQGLFVCFLSALVEHQVEETHRRRLSLTGWLRDDELLPFSPLAF